MRKTGVWTVWLLLIVAFAFGPEAALERRPAGYAEAVLDAKLAGWEAAFARTGLGGSANVGYGEDWKYGLALRLSLDPAERARAELAALEASRKLRQEVRQAVYETLTLHARAWRARAGREAAALALEGTRLRLEAARAQGRGPLDLEDLAYRVEDARLALQLTEAELQEVEDEVRDAGLSGPAEPRVLLFALPDPAADHLSALRLRQQRTVAMQAWRGLAVISAQARYLGTTGYTFEVSSAGPGLSLSVQHPATPAADEWRFGVAARITLSPAAWTSARRAGLAAGRLAADMEVQMRERSRRLVLMRRRIEGAWKRLQLAQKRVGLADRRAEQVSMRMTAGLAARLDALSARVAALQAEAQLADAWKAYVEAVKAYLDLADGEWRVE